MLDEKQLENLKIARNKFIMRELKYCKGVQSKFNTTEIWYNYKNYLRGLALGLNVELQELENYLDTFMLGTHDLKLLIGYTSVKELYKKIKGGN